MDQCLEPKIIGARKISKQRDVGEMAISMHADLDILI